MVTALAPEEIARIAAEAATEKQAIDVVLLDVRKSCTFADFFVVCTGDNDRQIAAIWEEILDMLRLRDVQVLHKEGAGSGWLLADYGSVVVHVFAPEEREYYQIESLWKDAIPVLRIQ
ncbi:MAG: ribosome silencing factor [Dehalococcoidia bacterium]|nr:ribosome silencing factor [Dehalococcoidia bacterium]